jgi:hypothetical protein
MVELGSHAATERVAMVTLRLTVSRARILSRHLHATFRGSRRRVTASATRSSGEQSPEATRPGLLPLPQYGVGWRYAETQAAGQLLPVGFAVNLYKSSLSTLCKEVLALYAKKP